jgi:nascent polypeptide-associated complex subunit alpha
MSREPSPAKSVASEQEDELPTLEKSNDKVSDDEGEGLGKLNRSEKKSRKAMQKLGMKPVNGINRVTIKKSKNILFVIETPDVFKSPSTDTYIVFGEAKIEDLAAQAQAAAAQQYKANAEQAAAAAPASVASTPAVAESEETVDETGLDAADVEMIMSQANVSRARAVKALRDHDGDMVTAIMALTQ